MICLVLPSLTIARPAACGQDRVQAKPGHGNYSLVNGVLEEQKKGDISRSRISMPQLLSHPSIVFPAGEHKTGNNKVEVVIGVDGTPSDVRIVHSMRADYDEQTMDTVQKYQFKPAELDGKATPIQIDIEVHYRLR